MHWIAPSEKDALTETLEKRRWDAADPFRANSGLKSLEYSAPALELIPKKNHKYVMRITGDDTAAQATAPCLLDATLHRILNSVGQG